MRFDYHTHTPLCGHATGSPVEYARAALAQGLGEIGFSDHNPMPTQYDDWRMAPGDFDSYLAMVDDAREKVPEIEIRLGMECDFIQGFEDHAKALRARAPFDYFIGSVHYVAPEFDIDNPARLDRWGARPVEEAWREYFRCVALSAESGLFEIIGHPDLCKKFRHRPEGDLKSFYSPAVEAIARAGVCIELNTSGRHKPVAEAYPSGEFLAMALEAGVRLVISSDAHGPHEVARDFDWAKQFAWDIGYREVQRFRAGRPQPVPLADF